MFKFFLVHFKNGPEYLKRETAQVFIPLMRFLICSLVSSSFLIHLRYSFSIFCWFFFCCCFFVVVSFFFFFFFVVFLLLFLFFSFFFSSLLVFDGVRFQYSQALKNYIHTEYLQNTISIYGGVVSEPKKYLYADQILFSNLSAGSQKCPPNFSFLYIFF